MNKKTKKSRLPGQQDIPDQINRHKEFISAQFSGPILTLGLLKQYSEIIPCAAERILAMAEEEASHQKYMEKTALHLKAEEIKRGQNFGLTIGLSAFLTCIITAYFGSNIAASVIGGNNDRRTCCRVCHRKNKRAYRITFQIS